MKKSSRLLTLGFLLELLAVPALASTPTGGFAAVSYSPMTNHWGLAWGWMDSASAQNQSKTVCNEVDCENVFWVHNAYGALATGDQGKFGWAYASDLDDAITNAISECSKLTTHCDWRAWVHSADNSTANGGESNVSGPAVTTLKSLGGAFEDTVSNFKGFKQQQSNWCWAATAESIYFMMTGARADQAQIARIHESNTATDEQQLGAETQTIDQASCEAASDASSARCDHSGNAAIALSDLGASLPFSGYPKLLDPAGTYQAIRDSLKKNLPVGIHVVWDDGSSHYVVAYGATYESDGSPQNNAKITLKVFDPWDGGDYTIESGEYAPAYKQVSGNWDGWIALGDYTGKTAKTVKPAACSYLTAADQARFCPKTP